jgi:hypothetical protein
MVPAVATAPGSPLIPEAEALSIKVTAFSERDPDSQGSRRGPRGPRLTIEKLS